MSSSNDGLTYVGVIMAGGSGERFWPLSRRTRPKQLLCLTQPDRCMLAEAVERLAPVIPPEHVYIVTGAHLVEPIREAKVGVPPENVIAEPAKRNTSGALAYAAAHILARYGGDGSNIMQAVTTADHLLPDPDAFVRAVEAALEAVSREKALATMGVTPTRPDTGFGYIQVRPDVAPWPNTRHNVPVYPVGAFHEKPSRERAEDFIASGQYFWNSGMFFWRLSTFVEECAAVRPELANTISLMTEVLRTGDHDAARAAFENLEDISIDYALMEHARHTIMVRADFPWDDVGSWPALERTRIADPHGNVIHGEPIIVDSRECIVYNDVDGREIATAVVGVEGLVVVVTRDAVLVIPKDRAQDVRHVVAELKRHGARQL